MQVIIHYSLPDTELTKVLLVTLTSGTSGVTVHHVSPKAVFPALLRFFFAPLPLHVFVVNRLQT